MMNTSNSHNTFDTLCSTWRDQLEITPLKTTSNQKVNVNDSVDLLLSNLLEDIWSQCERLFKQSEISAANMKFTTDNFCLHVMNQLISTQNKLYTIRRRKSQENMFSMDPQMPNKENVCTNNNNRFSHVIPCTNKTFSSSVNGIKYLEYLKQNDLQLNKISHSQWIVEFEKNRRNSQLLTLPIEVERKYPATQVYLLQNSDQNQSSKCSSKSTIDDKFEESTVIEDETLSSEEGSAKTEVTGSIPMDYFNPNPVVTPRHRSSPVFMLKPVYAKCKTTLPFLLDHHQHQRNSSFTSFTTLNDTGKSRASVLCLLPKKVGPSPFIFKRKKGVSLG
ncbi:hypothetical protein K501DRAFT_315315 [Backusella circina FSU 941]|nr:hypothetical protein K501DRAFT_315315 [Backusella circina FSU 941]